jgi:hypothetical protein
MRASRKILAAAALALVASSSAHAHHSAAMFDFTKTVMLDGVIKEFQWTNPHSWVQIVVKEASGKEVEWAIESGAPNGMARQGWKRTSLKPGDKAQLAIHPLRDGSAGGFLVTASMGGVKVGR